MFTITSPSTNWVSPDFTEAVEIAALACEYDQAATIRGLGSRWVAFEGGRVRLMEGPGNMVAR